MSELTPNLKLFKYDTLIDGKIPFSIDDALNQNWDILDSKIGTLPYVKKTGDTMTGNLNIDRSGAPIVYLDNNLGDYTDTAAPSSTVTFGQVLSRDKNNQWTGYLQTLLNTSNIMSTSIGARRSINGTNKSASIAVCVNSSGTGYAIAPASAVAGSILTTVAISKSANGYVKLGNGLILQWGYTSAKSNTFPIKFPSAVVSFVEARTRGGADGGTCFQVDSVTTSGFTTGFDSSQKLWYMALGY